MRTPLALLLIALAACAADPVLLPDAGPCNGTCGAGTVCQAGACVSVDGGAVDAGGGLDVGTGPVGVDVFVATDPAPIVDQGGDAGVADVDQRTSAACRAVTAVCDGRTVNVQGGETDGGRVRHCGGCGRTCAAGEGCLDCNCVPLR